MMLVEVAIRQSRIQGLGIFAISLIREGTPVSAWTPGVDYLLTPEQWAALPENLRTFLDTYAWVNEDGNYLGTVGPGRFTNHSITPNLKWDQALKCSLAIRDIEPDEELTENYEDFDAAFDDYKHELADIRDKSNDAK